MKNLLCLFTVLLLLLSCKKENNEITACGVHDPLTELDWLSELIEPCDENEICLTAIFQGIYNEETVFYTFLQGPLCDPAFYVALRNCSGNIVKEYRWEDHELLTEEVDSVRTIFSCWD